MMKEYHKIETVFNRDVNGTKKLIEGSFRNETVEMLKDINWLWTEKVDGCLQAKTALYLTDGTTISIADVVKNKMDVEILGFDGRNIVPTRVVGWHYNGQTDEWYKIKYKINGMGRGGSAYQTILCTGNHKFYSNGEYKRADELAVGDKISLLRKKRSLTYQQEQILTGLMVGDGSLDRHTSYRSISFSQKESHEEYVDWLLQSLGSIAGEKQKTKVSGYGTTMIPARTISCNQVQDFVSNYIKDGKKIIPKDIKLSPLSLAVMYMDDGSLVTTDGHTDRCSFALNDYDEESVDNLINAMCVQLDIHPVKYYSKGWNIRINTVDADKLQMLVSPYICECMQYKLSEQYRNRFVPDMPRGFNETVNTIFESEVMSIEVKKEKHDRYDITTETHNYFANGVLVHNCNMRIHWDGHKIEFGGRTEKAQIPSDLVNFLTEKFCNEETEELFEQKFGDSDVILFGEGYGKKIQKVGALYIPDGVSFILFDVCIGDVWLKRDSVEDIAKAFNIDVVPIVGNGTIMEAVEFVKSHPKSVISDKAPMEGVVVRPECELYDRMHRRIIVKIKVNDFK